MNHFCWQLPALIVLAAFSAGPATAGDIQQVVAEGAHIVVMVEDVPSFREAWPETPLGALWSTPSIQNAIKEGTEEIPWSDLDDALDTSAKTAASELFDDCSGQLALVLPDLRSLGKESIHPPWAVIADVRGQEGFQSMFEAVGREVSSEGEFELETGRHQGVDFSLLTKNDTGYAVGMAFTDDKMILAQPPAYLHTLIQRIAGGMDTPDLAGASHFQRFLEHASSPDAYVFFNAKTLSALVEEEITKGIADETLGTMGVSGAGVVEALALDTWEALFLGMTLEPEMNRLDQGLLYTEERGLTKLIAMEPGPCVRPDFVTDNAIAATVTRFNMTKVWETLLELADIVSPGIGSMIKTQATQLTASLGVDLETDLLANIGEDGFNAYFIKSDGKSTEGNPFLPPFDQLAGVSIKDRQVLESALDTLLEQMGPASEQLRSRTVAGTTVHEFTQAVPNDGGGAGDVTVSYAFTDEYLLIATGASGILDEALNSRRNPRRALWDRADVKPLLALVPDQASEILFYDLGAVKREVLDMVMQHMEDDEKDRLQWTEEDMAHLEKNAGPMVGFGSKHDDGILVRLLFTRPQ